MELITKRLRMEFQSGSPFLWTDCVTLRTQPPIDYDSLMTNSPIVQELDKIINKCLEDENMKNKLIKELGDIWVGMKITKLWMSLSFTWISPH